MQWHGKTCKYRHEQTSNMQEQMCDMGENSSATQKKIRENTRNKNFMNVDSSLIVLKNFGYYYYPQIVFHYIKVFCWWVFHWM